MNYLDQQQIHSLANAAVTAGIADAATRPALFQGIDHRYSALFATGMAPLVQTLTDLSRLNSTEKLTDGSIPLELWLSNVMNLTQVLHEYSTFKSASDRLAEITRKAPTFPLAEMKVPDGAFWGSRADYLGRRGIAGRFS